MACTVRRLPALAIRSRQHRARLRDGLVEHWQPFLPAADSGVEASTVASLRHREGQADDSPSSRKISRTTLAMLCSSSVPRGHLNFGCTDGITTDEPTPTFRDAYPIVAGHPGGWTFTPRAEHDFKPTPEPRFSSPTFACSGWLASRERAVFFLVPPYGAIIPRSVLQSQAVLYPPLAGGFELLRPSRARCAVPRWRLSRARRRLDGRRGGAALERPCPRILPQRLHVTQATRVRFARGTPASALMPRVRAPQTSAARPEAITTPRTYFRFPVPPYRAGAHLHGTMCSSGASTRASSSASTPRAA